MAVRVRIHFEAFGQAKNHTQAVQVTALESRKTFTPVCAKHVASWLQVWRAALQALCMMWLYIHAHTCFFSSLLAAKKGTRATTRNIEITWCGLKKNQRKHALVLIQSGHITTCSTRSQFTTYPQAMYGSTRRSKFREALFKRTKTPLWIWRRRRSWRTLRTFGLTPLILHRQHQGSKNYNISWVQ